MQSCIDWFDTTPKKYIPLTTNGYGLCTCGIHCLVDGQWPYDMCLHQWNKPYNPSKWPKSKGHMNKKKKKLTNKLICKTHSPLYKVEISIWIVGS